MEATETIIEIEVQDLGDAMTETKQFHVMQYIRDSVFTYGCPFC